MNTFRRAAMVLLLAMVSAFSEEPTSPPNVIVILADDMGYSDVGCYGSEIETPNLDRLAENGLRFTQFYSTGRCWPSRSVLMTGYYAQQVGMDPRKGKEWPTWTRLVPHFLKEANYRCYHSGKWHVRKSPLHPESSGFDRSYWTPDHDRYFSPARHLLDDKPLPPVKRSEGYYATTATANRAIEFLQQHQNETADQPFYLYLAFIAPHFPLHALPADIERYRDRYKDGWDSIREKRFVRMKKIGLVTGELSTRKPDIQPAWNLSEENLQQQIAPGESGHAVAWTELTGEQKIFQAQKMEVHAAMIDRMDQEIGRVMDQLKAMDAFDNTLIFFVSDNGASAEQLNRGDKHKPGSTPGAADSYLCLGPGWSTAANTPLTLHKHWNHEGGIASPLIMHWPEGIKARGEIRRSPGHFIDVVPTILDVAGLTPKPVWNGVTAPPFPGTSLRPAFEQEPEQPPRTLYFDHQGNRALREGDWKIVQRTHNADKWELYNLVDDRAENHDLAETNPERLQNMTKRWQELRQQWETDRVMGNP